MRNSEWFFLAAVFLVAAYLGVVFVQHMTDNKAPELAPSETALSPVPATAISAETGAIRKMIDEEKLSDREALFYSPVSPDTTQPPSQPPK